MKIKPTIHLISAIILVWIHHGSPTLSNPIHFDPTSSPFRGISPMHPLQAPMLIGPQFDPYAQMQMPHQFMLGSPMVPIPFADASRRSFPGMYRASDKEKRPQKEMSDEQKAMKDLPVSFIDPEEPQTISERISDSFSALGEGVRNHFRSMTENFSDTLDDIKDAWRTSGDSSNKRG